MKRDRKNASNQKQKKKKEEAKESQACRPFGMRVTRAAYSAGGKERQKSEERVDKQLQASHIPRNPSGQQLSRATSTPGIKKLDFNTVVFSFLFNKYYIIIK